MFNLQTKIICFVLIIVGNWLLQVDTTSADIFAERTAHDNMLKATTLSFSVRQTVNNRSFTNLFSMDGLVTDGFDVKAFRVKKDGKMDVKYQIKFKKTEGDDALCNKLSMQALLNGQEKYKGELYKFSIDSALSGQGKDDWVMFVGLEDNDSLLQNKICNFDLVLNSFYKNPDEEIVGFYAKRILTNTLASGNW
jgi:hypothetical protein